MSGPRYNYTRHANGEITSLVADWIVTYPATCNGRLGDLGFVTSRGYGGSDFVHFGRDGRPYGFPLTIAARERLTAMRRGFLLTD